MSNYRESLINRMINLYGYEHPAVIKFAELAEYWRGGDNVLRVIVESHEAYPLEDWEISLFLLGGAHPIIFSNARRCNLL